MRQVLNKCTLAALLASRVCVLSPVTPFWVTVAQWRVSGTVEVAVPVFLCVTFSAGLANTAGLPDSATVRPPLRPAATETQR